MTSTTTNSALTAKEAKTLNELNRALIAYDPLIGVCVDYACDVLDVVTRSTVALAALESPPPQTIKKGSKSSPPS